VEADIREDSRVLAGIEGVVHGPSDSCHESLRGCVEAKQMAVLEKNSETEISRCRRAISIALAGAGCAADTIQKPHPEGAKNTISARRRPGLTRINAPFLGEAPQSRRKKVDERQ
jgi:hypothetical protein